MSATKFLDSCYSGLTPYTNQLYFLPFSGTHTFLTSRETAAILKRKNSLYTADPKVDFTESNHAEEQGEHNARRVTFFLAPILLTLTRATFALALAISTAALLTKFITYPIAGLVDYATSPSF